MNPIHPALSALARAAKKQDFGEVEDALYVDPEGEFVMTAITWLPGQVSAAQGTWPIPTSIARWCTESPIARKKRSSPRIFTVSAPQNSPPG